MKFSVKDFFSKCDQIRRPADLVKKSLMENFIFCAVLRKSNENDDEDDDKKNDNKKNDAPLV